MDAVQPGAGRGRLATAVGWLTLGLACVALAVVEHERARAAATGRSVLCGSVLACSDGLEGEALAARRLVVAGKRKLPARPHRLQGLQAGEDDTGDGSAPPVGLEAAIDGFDLRTFGGEAPDVYEDKKYFGRYQEPGDNGIEQPVHPAPNVLDSYIGEDSYKPFYEHSRLLQPGDVPGDEPTPHHKRGLYNLFGALADTNENLLTGEMEAQACCKCIPGAPDYREKKDYMGVINPLTGVVPAVGAFLQDAETDAEDLAGMCVCVCVCVCVCGCCFVFSVLHAIGAWRDCGGCVWILQVQAHTFVFVFFASSAQAHIFLFGEERHGHANTFISCRYSRLSCAILGTTRKSRGRGISL